jgi:catechol 2,3-dioxygenase-like lactoylglutathione lyase family enzyme
MNTHQFALEHIGLAARHTRALKDWYIHMLGARLLLDNGQTPPAFLLELTGGPLLEIYPATAAPSQPGDNGLAGWRHLALRVDVIEHARDALAQKGIAFTEPIRPAGGGGRVLFFTDPENNLLHLVERTGAPTSPGAFPLT